MHRRALLRTGLAALGTAAVGSSAVTATESEPFEPLDRLSLSGAKDAAIVDDIAYVATTDGVGTVDLSTPAEPELLTERTDFFADHDLGPLDGIWDVWPDGDRLVAAGPANPIPNAVYGFVLLDISDPADLTVLDRAETDYPIHNTFFEDGAIYLTGNGDPGNPMVVFSTEDDELEEIAQWSLFDHDLSWQNVGTGNRSLHDLYVQDGLAYLLYWDAGTYILDVSDPAEPTYLNHIPAIEQEELAELGRDAAAIEVTTPPGNHHYGVLNDDGSLLALGKEAWAVELPDGTEGGPAGVELWDVSTPEDPTHLSTVEPPSSYDNTRDGWFTTSHNCDLVGDRLYTSWYFGGVKVHDISDPSEPEELAWWRDPTEASFWTAQAGEPGEYFVGSSADLGTGSGALYVFPDRTGEQPDPPSLEDGPGGAVDDSDDDSPNGATDTEQGDDSIPGFGVAAGVAGTAAGAYALAKRSADDEST